ncbi:MAG: hypothetical protein KC589_02340 [Nanoarchaeota archaeon]|nr:hypothetical protein [Nanoarchaeota archaeon]MCA9495756.1 hypothetical protein [Nanoarchaeota archaeon]
MIERKRDIYIRIDKIRKIVDVMTEIKVLEEELRELFAQCDSLNFNENKLFESWSNNFEDINHRLDHVIL